MSITEVQPLASPARVHEVYTAPKRTIWLWGAGGIADSLMIQTFGLVMPIFNTGFGLSSVLVSWAIMVPRLADAITDPIIGHLSDNTHTRWGRRMPYLVVTCILGAILVAGIWWASPKWSTPAQFMFLMVSATLYYVNWGIYSMTHGALGYELTDDYHERTRVMAVRTVYAQVVILGVAWTYWLALRPVFGGEINGIRVISAVMALLILTTGMIPVFVCKERFANANREHVPLFRSLLESLRIPAFRTFLAMRFCWALGLVLFNSMVFYLNAYYVCAGNKDLATRIGGISTGISVVATLGMFPFIPKISRLVGKRRGIVLGAAVSLLQACIIPLLFTPRYPYLQLVAALLFVPFIAVTTVLRDAIVPDICDLDELENGSRREGLFNAVIAFVYKLEVSFCIVVVGYLISISGFDPKVATQPTEVLTKLRWFAYTPNILFAMLALFFAVRFQVTEAQMKQVRVLLDDRRARQEGALSQGAND